jgi:hypothetical protein
MTTLELARAIADAVLATSHKRRKDSTQDAPTQAVIATLHATGTWFMRQARDDQGDYVGGTERPLALVRRGRR